MGSLCGGGRQTTVQTNNIPEWVSKGGEDNYGIAKTLSERPWQGYGGQRIADFTAPTQRAFQTMERQNGNWAGGMARAVELGNPNDIRSRDVTAATVGPISDVASRDLPDMDLSRYVNPQVQATLDPVIRELRRGGDIARNRLSASASNGAWGGSRHGVIEAEQMRNEEQAVSDATARAYGQAWSEGSQLAQSDRAAALQAALANQGMSFNVGSFNAGQTNQVGLANQGADLEAQKATQANRLAAADLQARIAAQGQEMGMRDVGAQLDIGERQRALEQSRLDTSYTDFQDQYRYPIEMLNLRSSALTGTPFERSVTTTGPGSNPFAQILGAGAAVAGIGGSSGFKWW